MKLNLYSLALGVSYAYLTAPIVANALESSALGSRRDVTAFQGRASMSRKRHWGTRTAILNTTTIFGEDEELVKRDGTKYVFMHHIVGNTYPYTSDDWLDDMVRIAAKGVDAIALNIGSSSWQRTQVAAAYAAAQASNTGIKLFYSFDLTEMPCDIEDLVARTNLYANHPNQFKVNGKVFISSYSGDCLGNTGWQQLKDRTNAYIMPFIWGLEGNFNNWPSLDSWYCWGCAWPQGNYAKNTNDDNYYISQLGGKYATTVSGWMYTHLSSKNFYLRGDDWLVVSRWEQLMSMRNTLTFAEMVTWNDWGESDYYGPFKGAQPDGTFYAEAYPHTAWFDMSEYYIRAFKTGVYPTITKSTIYFWARPHPAGATASNDALGKPTGYDWTEDSMWAAVFAASPATVTLTCGGSSQSFSVSAGVTKLKIPLAAGQMTVKMTRNGYTIINYTPSDYTYTPNPVKYNYNAWAGSATATVENPTSSSSASSTSSSAASSSSSASSSSATPTPTANTWNYLGCYTDPSSSNRLVVGLAVQGDNAQTIQTCQTRCSNAGYTYAGVEYGNECYCSNSLSSSAPPVAESQCTRPCAAASNQICGGAYLINVYKYGPTTSATPTSSTPTASATPSTWSSYGCVAEGTTGSRRALTGTSTTQAGMTYSTCQSFCTGYTYAGVEYGTQCFCGNSLLNNGASGAVIANSNCNVACGGDSSKTCGGAWTMTVFANSAPATTGSGWTSAGCFFDSTTKRMLRGSGATGISGLTTEQCISTCSTAGYTMAGTEYGNECYCGSQIFYEDGSGVSNTGCTMPCDGNSSQTCGGGNRLNLYLKPGTTI